MRVAALCVAALGTVTAPHPDVHVGEDGWLFLVGGSNRVLEQYRAPSRHLWRLVRWARLIDARARRCRRLGIRYLHVVVPEKIAVYDHRLGDLAVDPRRAPWRILRRLAALSSPARAALCDLVAPMRRRRDEADLFLRTDSHWTFEGCHVAYRAICEALGAAPRDDLLERPAREMPFLGDLGNKLDPPHPPETARPRAVTRDAVRTYASPLVERFEEAGRADALHVGAHVVYANDAPGTDPRRVVLFGDSYANFVTTIAAGLLTTMLAETFRELHFVWSASIDWDYVERVKPDILIFELSERFMARVPRDGRPVAGPGSERH